VFPLLFSKPLKSVNNNLLSPLSGGLPPMERPIRERRSRIVIFWMQVWIKCAAGRRVPGPTKVDGEDSNMETTVMERCSAAQTDDCLRTLSRKNETPTCGRIHGHVWETGNSCRPRCDRRDSSADFAHAWNCTSAIIVYGVQTHIVVLRMPEPRRLCGCNSKSPADLNGIRTPEEIDRELAGWLQDWVWWRYSLVRLAMSGGRWHHAVARLPQWRAWAFNDA
jgi:hypothetical protein